MFYRVAVNGQLGRWYPSATFEMASSVVDGLGRQLAGRCCPAYAKRITLLSYPQTPSARGLIGTDGTVTECGDDSEIDSSCAITLQQSSRTSAIHRRHGRLLLLHVPN